MMTALMLLALQTLTPTDARPIGDRLEAGEMCYTIAATRDGVPQALGRTLQIVRRETVEGRPVVRVLVHQQMQGGAFDVRDEFTLEPDDLQPIRYLSRRAGVLQVDVRYGDGAVTGYRTGEDGRREDIRVPLRGPVWEGSLWGVVFAAMPLSDHASFSLPFWQYEKGFGAFSLRVVGSETLSGPMGNGAAWVVEATDGEDPTVTYRIAKDRGLEISYAAGALTQTPGGDCSGLPNL